MVLNVLCVSALLCSCGGGDDGGGSSGSGTTQGQGNSAAGGQQSLNWSGYVLMGGAGLFTKVQGSWTVPTVTCTGDVTRSSSWAGIGGGNSADQTLVQAGTEQDCDGGASYGAWWEVIPAPSATLNPQTYPVGAGDHITVTADGSTTIVWAITIKNTSRGWTFNTTVPYVAAGATAEWIEEAPLSAGTGGAGQATLANFGRVAFTGLTANGGNPGLSTNERVAMVDNNNHVISNPSGPGATGNSFAVCYGSGACQ
jgi:hypothetical protein